MPLGAVGFAIPSLAVFACAVVARACLSVGLRGRGRGDLPVEGGRAGEALVKGAWVLLCWGSYVLCDVSVPEGKVRVRIEVV